VWEERILEQYENPLHQFAASRDMEIVKAYDHQIELLDQKLEHLAKEHDERLSAAADRAGHRPGAGADDPL
jgi:hypothetical protein